MADLESILAGMLADVRKQTNAKKKAQKKRKEPKAYGRLDVGPATVQNPWVEEALVLLMTVQTCDSCGSEYTSYNPYLLMERIRIVQGRKQIHQERIRGCDYELVYGQYPQRIDIHEHRTCACPKCFGVSNPAGSNLQLELPLGEMK